MSTEIAATMGQIHGRGVQRSSMADRTLLRLSATLLSAGVLLSLLASMFHVNSEQANDHVAAFTAYAHSSTWTAAHLGQFLGMAVLIAGMLVMFVALNVHTGMLGWAGRLSAVSAVVALALYGVLQAVDGVALKQAVDAWMRAPDAEKAARFASAEAIRWLEWSLRSYHSVMLGLALVLFATVIVGTARLPRPIGYLMGLSGLAYLVQGWVLGAEGFSDSNTIPTLLGIVSLLAWSIWFVITAWRMREVVNPPAG
jgi:hypothetical protein